MHPNFLVVLSCVALLLSSSTAFSQPTESKRPPGPPTVKPGTLTWTVHGGNLYQFNTSLDDGGSFSVNRAFLGAGAGYQISQDVGLDFSISSEVDSYSFRGGGTFAQEAGGVPWTTTIDLTLGSAVRWKINERWQLRGATFFGWAAEHDADFGNAFYGGGIIAGSYTFSRDLTLGGGLLVASRLEDNVLLIPALLVDWRINERLRVTNVRGPVTYPASAGVEILYNLEEHLDLSIGFRYTYRRFRLNDEGPSRIRNGVGTERSFPFWLRLQWQPLKRFRIHLLGGISFGERLELQESNGDLIAKQDVNPAPFVALFCDIKF